MNVVFTIMIIASLVMLIVVSPESAFSIMISGASSALKLAFTLIAIYAIWLSVLSLMEGIGLNRMLNRIFKPITKRLFKGESDLALEYITLNFSANLLGMGGSGRHPWDRSTQCRDRHRTGEEGGKCAPFADGTERADGARFA